MNTRRKVSTFKERFSDLCEESEKTITDLAKDLHVSYQTISAWRLGTRSPKEPTIIAIAQHFGVTVPWLMGFDVPKNIHAQELQSRIDQLETLEAKIIAHGIDNMPASKREQAINIIKAIFTDYADLFNYKE